MVAGSAPATTAAVIASVSMLAAPLPEPARPARNRTGRGAYVFLDVYLPEHGATAAGYRAVVSTTR